MNTLIPSIIRFCLGTIPSRYFYRVSLFTILCILFFPQVKGTCHELSLHSDTAEQFALPNCAIAHMMQDTTGYLWIATTCGLYKYDGYTFREYRHIFGDPNSLSHNRIRYLLQDRAGVIWVGTQGGCLNYYNPDEDNFEKIQPQTSDVTTTNTTGRVTSMLEDRSGRIWIATFEGLNILSADRSEFESDYQHPGDPIILKNEWIRTLHEDSEGFIWIATRFKGLYRYDPTTRRLEEIEKNFVSGESSQFLGSIASLYEDSTHHLWIGTISQGMYRMDPQRSQMIKIPLETEREKRPISVQSILEDTDRNIWAATSKGLFAWRRNGDDSRIKQTHLPATRMVISGHIGSLAIDRFGMLWIGFFDGGLTNINLGKRKQFTPYYFSETGDGNDQNIMSICEDALGKIWVKTHPSDDMVRIIDPLTRTQQLKSVKSMFPVNMDARSVGKIRALASDKDGFVWILSDKNNLLKVDPEKDRVIRKVSLSELFSASHPLTKLSRFLVVDGKDRFWIAGRENLFGPISPFWDSTKPSQSLSSQKKRLQTGRFPGIGNRVIFMYEGPATGIWAVTGPGNIYRYHEKEDEFTQYIVDFASAGCIDIVTIFDIYEDPDGWVWIATDTGLIQLDAVQNKIMASYSSQNGLDSEVVKGIVQDNTGDFWLGTLKGLVKLEAKNKRFIDFGMIEAFFQHPVMRVSSGRGLKSHAGRLYFSSRNGLVEFNPDTVIAQPIPPGVVINSVNIYEKNVIEASPDMSMINARQHWKKNEPLVLPFHHNAIQIEYSGIHFTSPEQNQYAVKLEGQDTHWQYVRSKRIAAYANLTPGNYEFRVKAANSHGVWNETGASLKFTVLKPYWATWWFATVVLGTIFIFIFMIAKLQNYRIERKNKLLEKHVTDRTRALEETQNKLLIQEKLSSMSQINRLEKDISTISERTRRQLGEALHDDICPHFLGVEAQADALVSRLSKQSSAHAPLAKEIQTSILEGIEKTRSVGKVIAPNYSMEKGLRSALDTLAIHVENIFNVHCKLTIHGNVDILDQSSEIDLYYIVQEAIYNAIKHGKPQEIEIVIKMDTEQLHTLTIMDDGCGIEGDYERARGMGLRIMDFRARRLGGTLEVKNNPMGGGMVQLTLDDSIKV